MSVYTDNGYESRKDYLACLADDYGVPLDIVYELASVLGSHTRHPAAALQYLDIVYELASVLGPNEDFDGLVDAIEMAAYGGEFDDWD